MATIEFNRKDRTTWISILGIIVLIVARVLLKIEQWSYPEALLLLSLIPYIFLLVYTVSDILKQKRKNKVFLIVALFLFPAVGPIAYMAKYGYSSGSSKH
jgi:uncharacterized membrane protein